MIAMIKSIIIKSGIDMGMFLAFIPVLSPEVINQIVIAVGIVLINTVLFPLYNLFLEWLKMKLKQSLPVELHDDIDKIGKKQETKKGE